MRDSKRFERRFPPLAKEAQGGFERASQNPPQSPFFKLIMSHISWLWTLQGEVPPFSKLALPTNRSAGDDPTPQALCIIALGCRVVSAATQGGGTSRWRPGVARTGQPQAMLRNTFGVVPQQTTSFSGRVQHRCLWARLGEGEAEPRTGSVQKAKMWVKISSRHGKGEQTPLSASERGWGRGCTLRSPSGRRKPIAGVSRKAVHERVHRLW